jgi:hypothetical protein
MVSQTWSLGSPSASVRAVAFLAVIAFAHACGGATVDDMGSGGSSAGGASGGSTTGGTSSGSAGSTETGGDPCIGLDEDACVRSDCGVYRAAPIDEAAQCWDIDANEFLWCQAAQLCAASFMIGRDPDGKLWSFGSHCLPPGWEGLPEVHYPECSDAGLGQGGQGGAR